MEKLYCKTRLNRNRSEEDYSFIRNFISSKNRDFLDKNNAIRIIFVNEYLHTIISLGVDHNIIDLNSEKLLAPDLEKIANYLSLDLDTLATDTLKRCISNNKNKEFEQDYLEFMRTGVD